MKVTEYIKLLNCMARFISYGKQNVLAIYEWEQAHLFKQTGKQATLLKSYRKWNEIENKIVSGKGVNLDIADCEEKIGFFDISQTTLPKHGRKPKETTDTISSEELTEFPSTDITEIGFSHKHRGLLLTALWTELSIFQNEYEKSDNHSTENLLRHISTIYTVHSHYKSNWQDENEVESVFKGFTANADTSAESYLLSAFYSQLSQTVTNLIIMIEQRFYLLVSNSDSEDIENYYMKIRFYDICDKEKIAVCRLKPNVTVTASLSIDSFEIMETLPYKPDMERTEFLEYLQSIFNNGLNVEHLVLVRRKDKNGVTAVTTYRVDVLDWGYKQDYINFEIVPYYYPIRYYLRSISSEILDSGANGGNEIEVEPTPQPKPAVKPQSQEPITPQIKAQAAVKTETKPQVETNHQKPSAALDTVAPPKDESVDNTKNAVSLNINKPNPKANQNKGNHQKKKPLEKKRTDILDKVNKLKEDIQNKIS